MKIKSLITAIICITSILCLTVTAAAIEENERDLLARVLYYETEGEPYLTKIGYAAMIKNRVENEYFPNSIHDVIYDVGVFDSVYNGTIYNDIDKEALWDDYNAIHVAFELDFDPTQNALFCFDKGDYHLEYVIPTLEIRNKVFAVP